MDGVDPVIRDESEAVLAEVPGVEGGFDAPRTIAEAHGIAESARHALLHEMLQLASAIIHADPGRHSGIDPHAEMAHHGAI